MKEQLGVLLVNLGTPDAPTTAAVRRYLRQFLSDRRVVDVNRLLWWPLLHGIILPLRSPKSAHAYREVWTERGSPLMSHSLDSLEALRARFTGESLRIALAMRYGNPSIAAGLHELRGCTRILVLPLFPQYSDATNGSVHAEAARVALSRRDAPALCLLPPFPDDAGYIQALAARVKETEHGRRIDHRFVSFHGIPKRYADLGDPYPTHCRLTAEALARTCGWKDDEWSLCFQSRFGREPWLQPYADEHVPGLAKRYPHALVLTPGFVADCLETIEEIGIRLVEDFRAAGGEALHVVPCLNAHPTWIDALEGILRRSCEADLA